VGGVKREKPEVKQKDRGQSRPMGFGRVSVHASELDSSRERSVVQNRARCDNSWGCTPEGGGGVRVAGRKGSQQI